MPTGKISKVVGDLIGGNFVDDVGNQDNHRPSTALIREVQKCRIETRLNHSRKAIETRMEQSIHVTATALQGHVVVNPVGKTEQTDRVALMQSDIAEHEHRVERIVQQAQSFVLVGHHATAVDQEHNALTMVALKLLDGQ